MLQISKNYLRGSPIYSVNEIIELAKLRKSVYLTHLKKILPAEVVICYQLVYILRLIEKENFYTIIKKEKT